MTITPTTVTIGEDLTFEITPLPFKKARKVSLLLARALGPSMAAALANAPTKAALKAMHPRSMGAALDELTNHLDDAILDSLFREFGEHCTWHRENGNSPIFKEGTTQDQAFRGRILSSFHWLRACVEVNFADFFTGLSSLLEEDPPAPPE